MTPRPWLAEIQAHWSHGPSILLRCGEMTAGELRTAKAVAAAVLRDVEAAAILRAVPSEKEIARIICWHDLVRRWLAGGQLLGTLDERVDQQWPMHAEAARAIHELLLSGQPVQDETEAGLHGRKSKGVVSHGASNLRDETEAVRRAVEAEREECARVAAKTRNYDDDLQRSGGGQPCGERIASVFPLCGMP